MTPSLHDIFEPSAHETCGVCGATADTSAIEDTNGWRWFSDGKGGLIPLCATCPVPAELETGSDDLAPSALTQSS